MFTPGYDQQIIAHPRENFPKDDILLKLLTYVDSKLGGPLDALDFRYK
jgi:hypothetical protein